MSGCALAMVPATFLGMLVAMAVLAVALVIVAARSFWLKTDLGVARLEKKSILDEAVELRRSNQRLKDELSDERKRREEAERGSPDDGEEEEDDEVNEPDPEAVWRCYVEARMDASGFTNGDDVEGIDADADIAFVAAEALGLAEGAKLKINRSANVPLRTAAELRAEVRRLLHIPDDEPGAAPSTTPGTHAPEDVPAGTAPTDATPTDATAGAVPGSAPEAAPAAPAADAPSDAGHAPDDVPSGCWTDWSADGAAGTRKGPDAPTEEGSS